MSNGICLILTAFATILERIFWAKWQKLICISVLLMIFCNRANWKTKLKLFISITVEENCRQRKLFHSVNTNFMNTHDLLNELLDLHITRVEQIFRVFWMELRLFKKEPFYFSLMSHLSSIHFIQRFVYILSPSK